MKTKNKIIHGKVEIDEFEFEPRNVKVRVTTMIDLDVLQKLKKIAQSKKQKYQTLLNQMLRSFVDGKKEQDLELKIRQIVREELRKKAK